MLLALAAAIAAPSLALQESHLGSYETTLGDLSRPVAVAFGPRGDEAALFVAFEGGGSTAPGVVAFDVPGDGAGWKPTSLEVPDLGRPGGLAVDGRGDVWISDALRRSLWRLPASGDPPIEIRAGAANFLPAGVAAHDGGAEPMIAVADVGRGCALLRTGEAGDWLAVGVDILVRPKALTFVATSEGDVQLAVTDSARHRVEIFALDGRHVSGFGAWGMFPSLLSSPSGIAVADGKLFVADTENHRVQAFDRKKATGAFGPLSYRFGVHAIRPGEGDGALHYPSDLAIDAGGTRLALAEPLDDRVQIFERAAGAEPVEDTRRAAIGPPGAHFGPPIAAAGLYLATVSPESHRVQIHDLRIEEPVRIAEVFTQGGRLGMLRGPTGVWLEDGGRTLLTVDSGNARLTRSTLRVRPDEPLQQEPELAAHLGAVDLRALVGAPVLPIAVARMGAPAEAGTSPLFTASGRTVTLDFGPIAVADAASDTVLLLDEGLDFLWQLRGSESTGEIRGIGSVAPTPRGTLLVVDAAGAETGGRVLEFDARGNVLRTFGEEHLSEPYGVAVAGGRIWVTDRGSDRVEIFVRGDDGSVVHERGFGGRGLGASQFHDPRGVAVLADGRVVILDHGNHRGQIFDAEGNFISGFGSRLYVEPLR
ncbi:MAG: NHL repeat-containing protein [Planctomycetota bacterium]